MSKKPLIAIDIDDTITESREGVREIVNRKTNRDIPLEEYSKPDNYWGYYNRVWAEHGIKDLDEYEVYAELHTDQTLAPLLPGAEFAIKELLKTFDIVLVTSRHPKWEKLTKDWFRRHFEGNVPDIFFCLSHNDSSAETKGQIARKLGAKWLIDDNVDHCVSAQKEGVTPVLFGTYGWHYEKPQDMLNLTDWPAVLDYFQSL